MKWSVDDNVHGISKTTHDENYIIQIDIAGKNGPCSLLN